jgi:hypothetical protein
MIWREHHSASWQAGKQNRWRHLVSGIGPPQLPISQGGAVYDQANLQSLCHDCHTERHGGRPRVQIDPATGLPLPGERHWWNDG